jgi:ATP-dependent protease ClpP protease subunit
MNSWFDKDLLEAQPTAPKNDNPPSNGTSSSVNNHIFFYRGVDVDSVADLNNKILTTNLNLKKSALDLGLDINIPIHLHIQSDGGSLLAGLNAADVISKYNIHTHVEGSAASAATVMSVCGKHRTISKHSFMLIHQLSTSFWGTNKELQDFNKNTERFMKALKSIYLQYTKIPEKKLDDILEHDIWFTPEESLEYGLVDEIV